ncbi:transcriptional regulator [Agrobacterium fabrum]|nr:AsnC family transcriptional regulator [Agrobacterium fabrum]CAD0212064.1 hypothetical protein AGTUEHA105_LOCUS3194 [Agrobacterium tumefaciens]MDH6295195.1 DNA-binding Lrp family transcriptional regulator [Agrobacterium fabrum]WJK76264.1 transcriptional regulator [Agrobacterium fabrum]SDB62092.1 transcriptional regulator, AsnC family [Agrobacterium fabrum]
MLDEKNIPASTACAYVLRFPLPRQNFMPRSEKIKKGFPHVMKLDRIDIKILYELQKNGRITNVELAELVNLSPSPCLMRVKKLQSEGYIEGYSAQININKLGQTLTVFTEITLKNHRQIDFARFLGVVEKIDQVVECHLVSGGYDYLLKFVTSGIVEYQSIMERLTDMDVGIDKYFSFVVLKSPIIKSHMPLTSLFPL